MLVNNILKKLVLIMLCCQLYILPLSSMNRETAGWCLSAFGIGLTSLGVYKIWQKEDPDFILVEKSPNSYTLNFGFKSNTAKGTILLASGLYTFYKAFDFLVKK